MDGVTKPAFFCMIYDGNQWLTGSDVLSFKVTKSVTSSIGQAEIELPHGSLSDFSENSTLSLSNCFCKEFKIWFGTTNTGSEPQFVGVIDSIKTELDSSKGYVVKVVGRDLGEALFRYFKNYDYVGYNFKFGYGSHSFMVGDPPYVVTTIWDREQSQEDTLTQGNLYDMGTGLILPANTFVPINFWGQNDNNVKYTSLPSGPSAYATVSDYLVSCIGSQYYLFLRVNPLKNNPASPYPLPDGIHSGYFWARLSTVDPRDTVGPPINLTPISAWSSSPLVNFVNNFGTLDIGFTITNVETFVNKLLYLELIWQIVNPPTTPSYFTISWGNPSYLGVPSNLAITTMLVKDLLSGSGITTGSIPWNDSPLTISYANKKIFDCINEVANISNWDFYVDNNGYLQAFTRRTRVRSDIVLKTGSNIFSFSRDYDVGKVKNWIDVKGSAKTFLPYDGEYWCNHAETGWTCTSGSMKEADTDNDVHQGSSDSALHPSYLYLTNNYPTNPTAYIIVQHTITPPLTKVDDEFTTLNFSVRQPFGYSTTYNLARIRLGETGSLNYFESTTPISVNANGWTYNIYNLGNNTEYDSTTGPKIKPNEWVKVGDISWDNINNVQFLFLPTTNLFSMVAIDNLHFEGVRWFGSAYDSVSSGSYGFRYYKEVSDAFISVESCQSRANEILSGSTNPINQLTILTTGSEGINAGDTITVDIPSESLITRSFDVLEITHEFNPKSGYTTTLELSDQKYIRDLSELKGYGIQRWYDLKDTDFALLGTKVVK